MAVVGGMRLGQRRAHISDRGGGGASRRYHLVPELKNDVYITA